MKSAIGIAQKLFDDMAAGFNLRADIDFREPRDQSVSSMFCGSLARRATARV